VDFDKPTAIMEALLNLVNNSPELAAELQQAMAMVTAHQSKIEHSTRNMVNRAELRMHVADRKVELLEKECDRLKIALAEHEIQMAIHRKEASVAFGESITDSLTGLMNRRGWDTVAFEVEKNLLAGPVDGDVAVIYMDLNDLREVNNTQGHDSGDDLIRRAAVALAKSIRKGDFAARIGGDEFMLLANNCKTDDEALTVVSRLSTAFKEAGVKVSMGVCRWSETGSMIDTSKEADRRMYVAKSATKYTKSEPAMH
jgi:diguanylate cyclase (GGDEF)-like protein